MTENRSPLPGDERMLLCSDWTVTNCCESCHQDYAEGYDEHIEGNLPDGRGFRVCCRVLDEINAGVLPSDEARS